ncbi:MAG: outer membrane protein transport protein, partial [Lentisphaeraceae bacterium]|nr:outer membrane protein transport protein [Lentisphaeraceae bacterium]
MRNVIIVLLFLLVLSLEATNGSAFLGIGPKQSAVAGAGVAKPEDSTWLALNPAGLVELESRVDSSLEFVVTQRKADMQGILAGDLSETENTTSYIPQVSAFWKLNEDEGFGLGFFSVGGVSTHFSKSRSALGQVGDFDRNIYFATSKLIVSYSRRLSNGWSFGFAPSIVHSTFKSDIMTGDLVQTNGDNDARSTFGGGYSLSAYKKWERLSFGFKYTSRQWTEQYEEYAEIDLRPLYHPRLLQGGFAYEVNEGLVLKSEY